MKREGTSNAMEWLAPLVSSEQQTLHILPTECLCHLLLITQAQNETVLSTAYLSRFQFMNTNSTHLSLH